MAAIHAKRAGYSTAYAGKYLNRYGEGETKRVPNGWDRWLGLVGNSRYYNYDLVEGGAGRNMTIHHHGDEYSTDYLPDVLINHTLSLLDELPEPWLVVVAWPSPHGPFTPAPWAKDTMSDYKAPITENYNASETFQQQKHWLMRQLKPLTNETAAEVDLYYQRRLETLKSVDDHVAKLISKLDQRNQLGNTVILYTSDNGFQFGQVRSFDCRQLTLHYVGLFSEYL
jgi:N-acetylglucosamine-6-sulfatase